MLLHFFDSKLMYHVYCTFKSQIKESCDVDCDLFQSIFPEPSNKDPD